VRSEAIGSCDGRTAPIDDRSALTPAGLLCRSCDTGLVATAKFCSECGAPVAQVTQSAEYKQVTVLFAEVVIPLGVT
jgi:adenylate cyclase